MGKLSYHHNHTDSEETEEISSSVENIKKKKQSLSKYKNGNVKKKKCKVHSKSEPEDSDCRRSRSCSSQRITIQKLRGILKHTERESSEEDEDSEPNAVFRSQDRCYVGRVPQPAGAKPGRGGGVAIFVRKHGSNLPVKPSTTSTKRRRSTKRIDRKRSY